MVEIKEKLANSSNYNASGRKTIKYIVVHYTGNDGDTALGNCNYFSQANRGTSAHYFVDETSIYRSVREVNVAWHVERLFTSILYAEIIIA